MKPVIQDSVAGGGFRDPFVGSSEPLQGMATPQDWLTLRGTTADWADTTVAQAELGGREIPWPVEMQQSV